MKITIKLIATYAICAWATSAFASGNHAGGHGNETQAIGKPGATPRMGPSGPGAPDGVGFVYALDCKAKTLLNLGGYSPKKPLELSATWRGEKTSPAKSPEDKALIAAACQGADQLAVK